MENVGKIFHTMDPMGKKKTCSSIITLQILCDACRRKLQKLMLARNFSPPQANVSQDIVRSWRSWRVGLRKKKKISRKQWCFRKAKWKWWGNKWCLKSAQLTTKHQTKTMFHPCLDPHVTIKTMWKKNNTCTSSLAAKDAMAHSEVCTSGLGRCWGVHGSFFLIFNFRRYFTLCFRNKAFFKSYFF